MRRCEEEVGGGMLEGEEGEGMGVGARDFGGRPLHQYEMQQEIERNDQG
jgi:hypothetical protein